jgi:hypothetical protein
LAGRERAARRSPHGTPGGGAACGESENGAFRLRSMAHDRSKPTPPRRQPVQAGADRSQPRDRATVARQRHSPIFWTCAPSGGPKTHRCHAAVIKQQYSKFRVSRSIRMLQNYHCAAQFCSFDGLSSAPWMRVLHICINRLLRQVGTASQRAEKASGRRDLWQSQNWGWRSTECSTN